MEDQRAIKGRSVVGLRVLVLLAGISAIVGVAQALDTSWGQPIGSTKGLSGSLLDPFTLLEVPAFAAGESSEAVLMSGGKPSVRVPKRPQCRSPHRPEWVPGPPPWSPGGFGGNPGGPPAWTPSVWD